MKNKILSHSRVLRLALPMIISNITTPLLGLVDTAMMGHLEQPHFLAAVALGGVIFNFIFWGLGFLRMGTTGLTAQASGRGNHDEVQIILFRGLLMALVLAVILLSIQSFLLYLSLYLLHASPAVEQLTIEYFSIRIWSAPATLSLYVMTGWFIGIQNVRVPLFLVISTNMTNIVLDWVLVIFWKMNISGVAWASVAAEYFGLMIALMSCWRYLRRHQRHFLLSHVLDWRKFAGMLACNVNIFIRTWCVIFAFAFFTAQSSRLGDLVLAANSVLMNFQTFMAFALDGFAHAAEALVGRAVGARDRAALSASIKIAGLWVFLVALLFTLVYSLFGSQIISLLTDIEAVSRMAEKYLPWILLLPLCSCLAYLFDGVFVGAMLTRQMRDSMMISLLLIFLPIWYGTRSLGNQGLWLAMIVFMVARSVTMAVYYRRSALFHG